MYLGSGRIPSAIIGARIKGIGRDLAQITRAVAMPNRRISSEMVDGVAGSFDLSREQVLDRKRRQEASQLTVTSFAGWSMYRVGKWL